MRDRAAEHRSTSCSNRRRGDAATKPMAQQVLNSTVATVQQLRDALFSAVYMRAIFMVIYSGRLALLVNRLSVQQLLEKPWPGVLAEAQCYWATNQKTKIIIIKRDNYGIRTRSSPTATLFQTVSWQLWKYENICTWELNKQHHFHCSYIELFCPLLSIYRMC